MSNEIYKKLSTKEYSGLVDTINLTNCVTTTLANIYRNGFSVDLNTLQKVREDFSREKMEIEEYLKQEVLELMGHTPINLNSPEQLSSVIYSR